MSQNKFNMKKRSVNGFSSSGRHETHSGFHNNIAMNSTHMTVSQVSASNNTNARTMRNNESMFRATDNSSYIPAASNALDESTLD